MLKKITQKDVVGRDDIHIFSYVLNSSGVKALEFGALFLLLIAVLVYPATHFESIAWMIVTVVLSLVAMIALSVAQYWRTFAKKALLAYDDEFLFVGNDPNRIVCIPWNILNIQNSGLAEPGKGANIVMNLEGEKVTVRLYTNVVCIPQFETILQTILTHIKENAQKK